VAPDGFLVFVRGTIDLAQSRPPVRCVGINGYPRRVPETFQTLAVLVVALLPGALYVWAFERQVGAWGIRLSDRVLRFVGFSAFLHAAFAPLTYRLWLAFVRNGRLANGDAPFVLWLGVLVYVALPTAVGTLVGRATRSGASWARCSPGRTRRHARGTSCSGRGRTVGSGCG
jgi:hypothetical protein